jgi:hypothetical protein
VIQVPWQVETNTVAHILEIQFYYLTLFFFHTRTGFEECNLGYVAAGRLLIYGGFG